MLVGDAEERADGAGLDVEHAHGVVRATRGEDAALEREREAEARELLQGDERGRGVARMEIDREDACRHPRSAWSDSVLRACANCEEGDSHVARAATRDGKDPGMGGVRVHDRASEVHASESRDDPRLAGALPDVPAMDDILAWCGRFIIERDCEQVAAFAAGKIVHGEVACTGVSREARRNEVGTARRAGAGGGPVAPEGEGAEGELLEVVRGERDERAVVEAGDREAGGEDVDVEGVVPDAPCAREVV